VGPRFGPGGVEKKKFFPYRDSNSDFSVVQPVASHYTNCPIPALKNNVLLAHLVNNSFAIQKYLVDIAFLIKEMSVGSTTVIHFTYEVNKAIYA
jgi:hypothetical protein